MNTEDKIVHFLNVTACMVGFLTVVIFVVLITVKRSPSKAVEPVEPVEVSQYHPCEVRSAYNQRLDK